MHKPVGPGLMCTQDQPDWKTPWFESTAGTQATHQRRSRPVNNRTFHSDFDARFAAQRADFDRSFKRTQKFAVAWFLFVATVGLALLSGAVFVVYKVLQHFGIL